MLLKTFKNKHTLNFFLIKLMFLFDLLLPYIQSVSQITYKNGFDATYEAFPKNSFEILFSNVVTNYVHIIVETESNSNQILSYGTEESCTINRQLLSMDPDPTAKVELFLTKSQIQSNTHNFLCIECVNDNSCKFKLKMISEDYCKLYLGSQYTYYVFSESNSEMTFNITNENYEQKIGIVTIWTRGNQYYLKSQLQNVEAKKEKYFQNGKIYSFKELSGSNPSYLLSITTKIGDLVTVGSSFSASKSTIIKPVLPNSYEIMGYLRRGEKEKECYILKGRTNVAYKDGSDVLFINGIIFNRYASFHYVLEEEIIYESSITDGSFKEPIFANYLTKDSMRFCVTFNSNKELYNKTELIYTFQLVDINHLPDISVYYPQMLGTIYTRYSLVGQLTSYSSMQPLSNNAPYEFIYNMKPITGFADMLFYVCNTYPKCDHSKKNLTFTKGSQLINLMTSYTYHLTGENSYSPISSIQPLILVNCTNASLKKYGGKDIIPKSVFCAFETSIYSNEDYLTLKENNHFVKFIRKGETNNYKILIEGEPRIESINLNIFLYTGDVYLNNITIINNGERYIERNGYQIFNNLFYLFYYYDPYRESFLDDVEIHFSVSPRKNSFYTISYLLVRATSFLTGTYIFKSGAVYSRYIYKEYINIENLKSLQGCSFLTRFYSLNCKFDVYRLTRDDSGNTKSKSVLIIDNYGQDIITNDQIGYNDEYYNYQIQSDNCMVYVSGIEIDQTLTGMEREIFVPESIPQQIIFEKNISKIKYAYHVADLNNPIIITFNLIDKAYYELKIYFGYNQSDSILAFDKNSQFFVTCSQLNRYCIKEEVCTIILEIIINRTKMIDPTLNPKLETIFRQTYPTYLQENKLKRDILNGNHPRYFYYFIKYRKNVEVTINYNRGSGKIYGKIISNWIDTSKFPKTIEESVQYDIYLKRLIFNSYCRSSCYLLISIESSANMTQYDPFVGQPFSIMGKSDYSTIKIEIDEYVVDTDGLSHDNYKYQSYEFLIPYDADNVIFDVQNDFPSLLVYEKDSGRFCFNLTSVGHDTIFILTKEAILKKFNEFGINVPHKESIKDINLRFDIFINNTSIYAFKVHLAKKKQIDIYYVRIDQKVLCKPEPLSDGTFRCLYAVILDGLDTVNSLTVLPRSQSSNAHVVSYSEFLEQSYFEKNDIAFLEKNIPENSAKYKSDTTGKPYIYLEKIPEKNSLYISVISNNDSILELLSFTSYLNEEIIQNPATVQLLNTKNKLTLNFMPTKSMLINVVPVSGSGIIYIKGKREFYFNINDVDDRLSLTFGNSTQDNITNKLCFENTAETTNEINPGFLFYLTYYPRTIDYNCELISIGKSIELSYHGTDFPINFIVPLRNLKTGIHASLNFYEFEDNKKRISLFNIKDILSIWGTIISEKDAYKARQSKNYKPEKEKNKIVNGLFDGGINVGFLFFDENVLYEFENLNITNPYLFFSVEKNKDVKFNFSKISAEVLVFQESGYIQAKEKVYQYGRINIGKNNSSLSNVYILNVTKQKPYMQVQFSANSDKIDWCINTIANSNHNMTFDDNSSEYYNGKSVLTFRIPNDSIKEFYLNVYVKNNTNFREYLGNYVFKYLNAYTKGEFTSYKVNNDTLNVSIIKSNKTTDYHVKLNPISNSQNLNAKVSYILKGIYNNSYLKNESTSTIAMTNSEGFTYQIDHPKIDENNLVSISVLNISSTLIVKYLKVTAIIKNQSINEYIAYESSEIEKEDIKGEDSSKIEKKGIKGLFLALIIIASVVFVIIIGIVIAIFVLRKKKKNLTDNVKQTSFVDDECCDKKDSNTNLLTPN